MSASLAAPSGTRPRLDQLPPAEAEQWARRLRATAHPCGCKSGAAASLFAMLFWPVFVVVSGRVPRSIAGMLVAVVVYGGVVIGAGVAGKVVGIVVARRTHRRVRRQLQARYAFLADQGR